MDHKPLPEINKEWTLFLDRDGVINHEKANDYIHTWEEFTFYRGVPDAMKIFAAIFGHIIVVTNQRGVGRGLTKQKDLDIIHNNMCHEIKKQGGHIDRVFYCTDIDNDSPNRKPNPGMAYQAKKQFPTINFAHSLMVGNTLSDMQFGRSIGAFTVFLTTTRPEVNIHDENIDAVYPTLLHFAQAIKLCR